MKALVGAFNQEKALVGAFSVIVQLVVEPMEYYTALVVLQILPDLDHEGGRLPAQQLHLLHQRLRGQVRGGQRGHRTQVRLAADQLEPGTLEIWDMAWISTFLGEASLRLHTSHSWKIIYPAAARAAPCVGGGGQALSSLFTFLYFTKIKSHHFKDDIYN